MSEQNSDQEILENKSSGLFSLPAAFLKKLYVSSEQKQVIQENYHSHDHQGSQNNAQPSELSKNLLELVNYTQKIFQNDEAFATVKNMANEVANEDDSNHVLLAFIGVLNKVSKKYCIEKESDVFQIPVLILKNFQFEKEYQEKVNILQKDLKKIDSIEKLHLSLQSVFELIYSMYQDVHADKQELEKFLFNIGAQISHIGENLYSVVEEQESDLKAHGDLNIRMTDTVALISRNITADNDLISLKNTVKDQLDSLQSIVEEERQLVKAQESRIQKNVKVLVNRVHELQKEAQELRDNVQRERERALKDTLTGINNRKAYDEEISALVSSKENKNTCLLIWDIDHFKRFNDQYGHVVGDKALKSVAEKMHTSIQDDYFLARYGGEEFVMLIPSVPVEEAEHYANALREDISNIVFLVKGKKVKITVSCGITTYQKSDTEQTIFERADQALYTAKQEGRNRVIVAN